MVAMADKVASKLEEKKGSISEDEVNIIITNLPQYQVMPFLTFSVLRVSHSHFKLSVIHKNSSGICRVTLGDINEGGNFIICC